MITSSSSNVTFNFIGDIILDGNNASGGIESSGVTTINGGTIQNCYAPNGGGVYSNRTLTINDTKLQNNSATYSGGGVCGNILSMSNVLIVNNTANGAGGGVSVSYLTLLEGVQILQNKASDGAGIYFYNTIEISGEVIIAFNNATNRGGGICYSTNASNTITLSSNVLIKGNTAIEGGGIYHMATGSRRTDMILSGNVKIINNVAESHGGGIYGNVVNISGGVLIDNNIAGLCGGGVFADLNDLIVSGSAYITNNNAHDGGGLYGYDTYISGNALIENNIAANNGGGVFSRRFHNISGNAIISRNIAFNGGGAYSNSTTYGTVISDNVKFEHNIANNEGGGIYVNYLSLIGVATDVIFTGNTASSYRYWLIDEDTGVGDSHLHRSNILTTHFSSFEFEGEIYSFDNAFNNYDINYTKDVSAITTIKIQFVIKGNEASTLRTIKRIAPIGVTYTCNEDSIFHISGTEWQPILGEATPGTSIAVAANPSSEQNIIIIPCIVISSTVTHSVTYNLNGGEGLISDDVDYPTGATVNVSSFIPTYEGLIFLHWTREQDGTGDIYLPGTSFNIYSDIVLYAQWEIYAPAVYIVDIEWNDMVFEFSNGQGKWNYEEYDYTGEGAGTYGWSIGNSNLGSLYDSEQSSSKITITNHSNKAISVKFAYSMPNSTIFNESPGPDNVVGGFYNTEEEAKVGSHLLLSPTLSQNFSTLENSLATLPTAEGRIEGDSNLVADVYFALSGTPDKGRSSSLSNYEKAGIISIIVTPNHDQDLNLPGL